jgi:beta-galactosidase
LRLKEGTLWAEKGHEVAWEQFILTFQKQVVKMEVAALPEIVALEDEGSLAVTGEDFKVVFSKVDGD